jgi:hypothetical protein
MSGLYLRGASFLLLVRHEGDLPYPYITAVLITHLSIQPNKQTFPGFPCVQTTRMVLEETHRTFDEAHLGWGHGDSGMVTLSFHIGCLILTS